MRSLYILPVLGALLGGFEFLMGFRAAQSAPQQAASAAMAVAWAVLPYVFARSVVEAWEGPPRPAVVRVTAPTQAGATPGETSPAQAQTNADAAYDSGRWSEWLTLAVLALLLVGIATKSLMAP